MHTTPVSLLDRLRRPHEQAAWDHFVDLYSPLLYRWAQRLGMSREDAADFVQDIFTVLVRKLPEFDYNPRESFRCWLRAITVNKWRDRQRRRAVRVAERTGQDVQDLATAADDDEFAEAEYRRYVTNRALQLLRTEFQPVTWQAFERHMIAGRSVQEVAAELGITANAVYLAKSRVLRRLREQLAGLLD